jgi:hypothetical protein
LNYDLAGGDVERPEWRRIGRHLEGASQMRLELELSPGQERTLRIVVGLPDTATKRDVTVANR